MKLGDIVLYKDRQWYLKDLYGDNLCQIVIIRDGKYTHEKQGVEYLNANIVNLNANEIKPLK